MTEHSGEECIALAVGGTGGHVIPAIKIAEALPGESRRILIGVGIAQNPFVMKKDYPRFNVLGLNFSDGVFVGLKAISKGVKEAIQVLKKQRCTHVIGMGGFHSLPVLIAAMYLRVPITLYEPNIIPGKVNKLFSLFSKRTLILFEEVKKDLFGKAQLINLSFYHKQEELPSKELLREEFGLDSDVTTILVFGGSKGATAINSQISDILVEFDQKIQVIHLTGVASTLKDVYTKAGIKSYVATFFKDMDRAWQACDFAICRAGAGTVKESLIHRRPSILLPYPFAVKDHQLHNARFLEKRVGGATVFEEKDFCRQKFIKALNSYMKDENRNEMIKNIDAYMNGRKGEYLDSLLL